MRKITEDSIRAFNYNEKFNSGNTVVELIPNVTILKLHSNKIAHKFLDSGKLFINTCGWNTVTTRARLNGLPNVSVYQKNYVLYLNGVEWDGKNIEVK